MRLFFEQTSKRRPDGIPFGQWINDFDPQPSDAEKNLIDASVRGNFYKIHEHLPRANECNDKNIIRASIIRFLILGGDEKHPTHPRGVQLEGAWIDGELNLDCCEGKGILTLTKCYFDKGISATDASLCGLCLDGSFVPRISADRIKVSGDVMLRNRFCTDQTVSLVNAKIDGDLNCEEGNFKTQCNFSLDAARIRVNGNIYLNRGFYASAAITLHDAKITGSLICTDGKIISHIDRAIFADRVVVNGSVNLNNGFHSLGELRFFGATIGSNLQCVGGIFDTTTDATLCADGIKVGGDVFLRENFVSNGEIRLPGASIGGDLECQGATLNKDRNATTGRALNLRNAYISGRLKFYDQNNRSDLLCNGAIDLTNAHVGTLTDSGKDADNKLPNCWSNQKHYLDGFTYNRIEGTISAAVRIQWLKLQYTSQTGNDDFVSQPWEQLIKVLRDSGYPYEADSVAIAKQKALNQAGKIGQRPKWVKPNTICGFMSGVFSWTLQAFTFFIQKLIHFFSEKLIGFGYKPINTFFWTLFIVIAFSFAYDFGNSKGYMVPASIPIMLKKQDKCGAVDTHSRTLNWNDQACTPLAYPHFQPFWYSLDVFLPVVNLGQKDYWSPLTSDEQGNNLQIGIILRWFIWLEILLGWAITLFIAAFLGNAIRRR